ncbi:MAG: hypothetical protein OXF06_05410 [Bacteroidetes bacterium]|nr:hypothetical protein [Bacteroidota bacterium]
MLSHQLPQLPPITSYLEALSELFDWIECGTTVSLMPIARDSVALRNHTLDLPIALNMRLLQNLSFSAEILPGASLMHFLELGGRFCKRLNIKKHFEKIRFAGMNHLCVNFHNQQSICRIEPYSMVTTSSTEIVLQQLTYPMEDMQPFYPVEFKM